MFQVMCKGDAANHHDVAMSWFQVDRTELQVDGSVFQVDRTDLQVDRTVFQVAQIAFSSTSGVPNN